MKYRSGFIWILLFVIPWTSASATSAKDVRRGRKPASASVAAPIASEVSGLKAKIEELDRNYDRLESEVEVLKAQSRLLIQNAFLNFENETYFKAGFSLLLPRSRTFDFSTDTGLGAYIGIGQYLGRNNVVEVSFDWDLYPSMTVRYRYEFHRSSPPLMSFGPILGYKIRALNVRPFDNYLEKPDDIKSSFMIVGGSLSFPLTRSLAVVEVVYLFNQQAFLVANCGMHFFF